MNRRPFFRFLFLMGCMGLTFNPGYGQVRWQNPTDSKISPIEGQAWSTDVQSPYNRLPARAKALVRPPVWNLSRQSAGLVIRFKTNASQITVRYQVGGGYSMPHMPATGVSGVDLYAVSDQKNFLWCAGKRSFGDTVTYRFSGIEPSEKYISEGREFRLSLPLYNSVKSLQINALRELLMN